MYRPSKFQRTGATAMECSIILPFTFGFLFLLIIGAMGVFRYQELATLAREGARYASTHGFQHRKDMGLAIGTPDEWSADIYQNAIEPNLIALDKTRLTYKVEWPNVINQPTKPDNWPGSKVDVTVTYSWIPGLGFTKPIILTSKSSMPITN